MDEIVPLRAALQITSLEQNKEYRGGGGRQIRMKPGAGRGEEISRMPGEKPKYCLSKPACSQEGSDIEYGGPENCVWLRWDMWVYLLSARDCTASSSSLSKILTVINAITWCIQLINNGFPLVAAPSPASTSALSWQLLAVVLLVTNNRAPWCGSTVAGALTKGLEEMCRWPTLVSNQALSQHRVAHCGGRSGNKEVGVIWLEGAEGMGD